MSGPSHQDWKQMDHIVQQSYRSGEKAPYLKQQGAMSDMATCGFCKCREKCALLVHEG